LIRPSVLRGYVDYDHGSLRSVDWLHNQTPDPGKYLAKKLGLHPEGNAVSALNDSNELVRSPLPILFDAVDDSTSASIGKTSHIHEKRSDSVIVFGRRLRFKIQDLTFRLSVSQQSIYPILIHAPALQRSQLDTSLGFMP